MALGDGISSSFIFFGGLFIYLLETGYPQTGNEAKEDLGHPILLFLPLCGGLRAYYSQSFYCWGSSPELHACWESTNQLHPHPSSWNDPESLISLPVCLKSWDYRCVPPHLASLYNPVGSLLFTEALWHSADCWDRVRRHHDSPLERASSHPYTSPSVWGFPGILLKGPL